MGDGIDGGPGGPGSTAVVDPNVNKMADLLELRRLLARNEEGTTTYQVDLYEAATALKSAVNDAVAKAALVSKTVSDLIISRDLTAKKGKQER